MLQENTIRISNLRKKLTKSSFKTPLIGGLFPRSFVSVMSSKSGVGKTWFVLKMSCDLSKGGNIANGLAPTEPPRKVLIFSGETGAEILNQRFGLTNWEINDNNLVIYELFEFARNNVSLMLNEPEGMTNIRTIVSNEKPDIIFIDTLISFHKGDENVAKDMAQVFGFLQGIAHEFNCAIVVMHHLRKRTNSGKENSEKIDQDDVIGSSATARLAGVIFVISRNPTALIPCNIVKNVKTWLQQVPDFQYTIKNIGGTVDVVFDTVTSNPNSTTRYKLTNFINSEWETGKEYNREEIAKMIGINRNLISSYLQEFVEKQKLWCDQRKGKTGLITNYYTKL